MRISKVTTKTGDSGTTGLADGSRVSKADPKICAIGDVDELNSIIGNAKVVSPLSEWKSLLTEIQNDLFNLGGELSLPNESKPLLNNKRIDALEILTNKMNNLLSPLEEFILPEGNEFATRIHMARAICRRAERSVINIIGTDNSNVSIRYLNRLSDYLFVLARSSNQIDNSRENQWNMEK
ncbi:MAG: cob(I)yrinic acid a,c-diamide adenosyltransferase [Candidatus Marinimicrobia bacterium]|jgi:cob(I)alamin adenosyltransferase|nr:cob(I)yrinic acid a,c-diamide adenosyltransferase [Candidatus Neomarinimicrobiota bacterium]MBT3618489.1 cob(I)yrinic acid a,c-diamide adenosyltransferase [Candidatus Neomarinimicrobiota bacterium]MBT3828895.1 cob(I)yrinic acid a,c-diamide adenosyltransferase [Candidatus Neomarinimicrobiota bacterium]MBT3997279.1 cob(I)yrinic acid a,c-diamide adenosyltransferase [Candidatus Neomarinimicrobiota bacterium]MBT4281199.1 cob(I)yrinic acid a,c-diamide adenosyltransferase [Candidatus Neomarinimicro